MGGHRGTREKGCPWLYFSTPPGVFSLGTCVNTPCMCLKGNPNGSSRRKRSERKRRNSQMHATNGNVKGAMGSKGPAGPKPAPAPKPATKFCKVCDREGCGKVCGCRAPGCAYHWFHFKSKRCDALKTTGSLFCTDCDANCTAPAARLATPVAQIDNTCRGCDKPGGNKKCLCDACFGGKHYVHTGRVGCDYAGFCKKCFDNGCHTAAVGPAPPGATLVAAPTTQGSVEDTSPPPQQTPPGALDQPASTPLEDPELPAVLAAIAGDDNPELLDQQKFFFSMFKREHVASGKQPPGSPPPKASALEPGSPPIERSSSSSDAPPVPDSSPRSSQMINVCVFRELRFNHKACHFLGGNPPTTKAIEWRPGHHINVTTKGK